MRLLLRLKRNTLTARTCGAILSSLPEHTRVCCGLLVTVACACVAENHMPCAKCAATPRLRRGEILSRRGLSAGHTFEWLSLAAYHHRPRLPTLTSFEPETTPVCENNCPLSRRAVNPQSWSSIRHTTTRSVSSPRRQSSRSRKPTASLPSSTILVTQHTRARLQTTLSHPLIRTNALSPNRQEPRRPHSPREVPGDW